MRSVLIASTGEARRFRNQGCGCVGVCVVARENSLATRLARHAHEGDKIVGCGAGNTAFGHAAVAVAIEHPAFAVHRDFVEVEKVAVLMAATLLPDASHAL